MSTRPAGCLISAEPPAAVRPLHLLYVLVAMHPWVAVRAQRTAVERCMTRAVYADDFVTHPPPGYPHVEGGGVHTHELNGLAVRRKF